MIGLTVRFRAPALACFLLVPACSGDDGGGNVLPTTTGDTAGTDTAGTTGGGMGNVFPATFRFSCVDIQGIGGASGDVFQATLLEMNWQADIKDYKLNILADVLERDETAGTATMQIRSGIGTAPADLCSEVTSESMEIAASYDAAAGAYGPSDGAAGTCSDPSTEVMGGTYELQTTADQIIHIYAEDDDGTTFNCTADAAKVDAVPVRAVTATFTQNEEGTRAWGLLTGCLVESEAEELCSCIDVCTGNADAACDGCPTGSRPLRALLGDEIQPDTACSDTIGEPAFTITMAFTADLLPAVPGSCG